MSSEGSVKNGSEHAWSCSFVLYIFLLEYGNSSSGLAGHDVLHSSSTCDLAVMISSCGTFDVSKSHHSPFKINARPD